jgi:hypothetical protein
MTIVRRTPPATSGAPGGSRADKEPPLKHVIDEYKHRAQTVTCVCGWHGSTATVDKSPSDWSLHVAANRNPR